MVNSSGEAPISPMMGLAANTIMPVCRNSMTLSTKTVASNAASRGCRWAFMSVLLCSRGCGLLGWQAATGNDDAPGQLVRLLQFSIEHIRGVGGARADAVLANGAIAFIGIDGHAHGQAKFERMGCQLLRVERNADRYPLHNLDPVASRILSWQ